MNKEILTIEDLKAATISIQKMSSKPLPKGLSWLARIMAKFGWHRQYEILVFDRQQFQYQWPRNPVELTPPQERNN